jgi:hypothetical protein
MPSNLTILRNVALPASALGGLTRQTSTVGEPSLANNGTQIFFTGNWYAARSLDNAGSWSYISPFTTFPSADGGFCCDQTLIYDPSRDITIWLLQYIQQSNTNTLRVAVKKGTGGGVFDFYHDLKPVNVNAAWAGEWFDYNSAALSNNYLYITSNSFKGDAWQRAVVFRIPLDNLASGGALSYNYFSTTNNGSLRCTLGARDTMYFGSQNGFSQVRVFTWPESSTSVTFHDVNVTSWSGTRGTYSAPGPDGKNWLSRTDGRITGAFLSNGVIWFLWSANTQTGRPMPYVRVVRINAATNALVSEPDIWSSSFAYAYPDGCVNDSGDIGITLFRGGGAIFPSHVVGIWQGATNVWQLADTKAGTNGPQDGKWGDYLTCRRHSPDGQTFIASGYTLQGGGLQSNIEPRYVHFGAGATGAIVSIASAQFAGVVLRMDGSGVTQPTGPGGGIVNCQFGVDALEKFRLEAQSDGTTAIASIQFPGVYLRMDGSGVTQPTGAGGGIVNCQFGVGAWEKFRLEPQSDGTTAIASVQFQGVYLRMDGSGVTQPSGAGGIVNCQFGVGAWEKFKLTAV